MSLEAPAGLEDRGVRERVVDALDPPVGAVVPAAVDADRPVDAMHQPDVRAGEAAQAASIEVERVEEAGPGSAGDPVSLDGDAARLELAGESADELVAAARGGGT